MEGHVYILPCLSYHSYLVPAKSEGAIGLQYRFPLGLDH